MNMDLKALAVTAMFLVQGGVMAIGAAPVVQSVQVADGHLVLSGSGGSPNGSFVVLAAADMTLPLANWTPVATNTFDANGAFKVTNGPVTAMAQQVYVLKMEPGAVELSGELKAWHPVTLTFAGPQSSETAIPNPFSDYRLDVVFVGPAGQIYTVPGYFAADGAAGESSAAAGNKWRVKFCPDAAGDWTYQASFVQGASIAAQLTGGASAGFFDSASGSFTVAASDKTGVDLRGKGKLEYVDEHYLRFRDGEYFLKAGANVPETFLEYNDFDGTPTNLDYSTHVADWQPGDPTWQGTKGKGIIGALNYLSGLGVNSMFFLTMNSHGDGKKAWPWTGADNYYNYDCSKLDQWDVVFSHMDKMGMMLHLVTTETENEVYFEVQELGTTNGFANSRKIYYRELVARFGYHLAVAWNLGEESGWNETNGFAAGSTTQQRKNWADYLRALTYYRDHLTVHNGPSWDDSIYQPLLGHPTLTGIDLQWAQGTAVHAKLTEWWNKSETNGHRWVICLDEPWISGARQLTDFRTNDVWGSYLAGAAGCEYFQTGDGSIDDFRPLETFFTTLVRAQKFVQANVPYTSMAPKDNLVTGVRAFCFAAVGQTYLIYFPRGGAAQLNLTGAPGTYQVAWFDPRNGNELDAGAFAAGESRSVIPPDGWEDALLVIQGA